MRKSNPKPLPVEARGPLADAVLVKYEAGDNLADLAKANGLSETQLYRMILKERPENWKAIRAAKTIKELDEAKQKMREASDHLELAKWDKLASRHSWELERVLGTIYGQKSADVPATPVQININLRGDRPPITVNALEAIDPPKKAA